jgi:SAM-dependent methyltransferase
VIALGYGTGALAVGAAAAGARVHAVDVSPAVLDATRQRAQRASVALRTRLAGFLTYQHEGPPADGILTRCAFHDLPDPWKTVALTRRRRRRARNGRMRVEDVTYSFPPERFEPGIERRIAGATALDGAFSRPAFVAHVRDEPSTFTWAFESMLERCGLVAIEREPSPSTHTRYPIERRAAQPPEADTPCDP